MIKIKEAIFPWRTLSYRPIRTRVTTFCLVMMALFFSPILSFAIPHCFDSHQQQTGANGGEDCIDVRIGLSTGCLAAPASFPVCIDTPGNYQVTLIINERPVASVSLMGGRCHTFNIPGTGPMSIIIEIRRVPPSGTPIRIGPIQVYVSAEPTVRLAVQPSGEFFRTDTNQLFYKLPINNQSVGEGCPEYTHIHYFNAISIARSNTRTLSSSVPNARSGGPNIISATFTDGTGRTARDQSRPFYIDVDPPTVTISPNSDTCLRGDVTVTARAQDNPGGSGVRETRISAGAASRTCPGDSCSVTIGTTTTGRVLVAASAVDNMGNGSRVAFSTLTIDNTPPTIHSSDAFPPCSEGTINIAARVTDQPNVPPCGWPGSVKAIVGGTEYDMQGGPEFFQLRLTGLAEGIHRYRIRARDSVGNESLSEEKTFVVSRTPPRIQITAPPQGSTVRGVITVSAQATATIADLASMSIRTQSFTPQNAAERRAMARSISLDTRLLPNGTNYLDASATDICGQTASTTIWIIVDNGTNTYSPSSLTLLEPTSQYFNVNTIRDVRFTAELVLHPLDQERIRRVRVIGFTFPRTEMVDMPQIDFMPRLFQGRANLTQYPDGRYVAQALAEYEPGPGRLLSNQTWFIKDTVAPFVQIVRPTNGATISGTSTVVLESSESAIGSGLLEMQLYLDDSYLVSFTTSPDVYRWRESSLVDSTRLISGSHKLRANARDRVGNAADSLEVVVNVQNPPLASFRITAPPDQSIYGGGASIITITASNPYFLQPRFTTWIDFLANDTVIGTFQANNSSLSMNWTITRVPEGRYQIKARLRDQRGNSVTCPSISIVIDRTPPECRVISPAPNDRVLPGSKVKGWARDGLSGLAESVYFENGIVRESQTTENFSFTLNPVYIPGATVQIQVDSWDKAGNRRMSCPPSPFNVTIDDGSGGGGSGGGPGGGSGERPVPPEGCGKGKPAFSHNPFNPPLHGQVEFICRLANSIVEIYDKRKRLVFSGSVQFWDGRNQEGQLVVPGAYHVNFERLDGQRVTEVLVVEY